MYYKGKLYGKSRGRYFEMEETSEDVDRLKERIKELESLVSKNESLHLVMRCSMCDSDNLEDCGGGEYTCLDCGHFPITA